MKLIKQELQEQGGATVNEISLKLGIRSISTLNRYLNIKIAPISASIDGNIYLDKQQILDFLNHNKGNKQILDFLNHNKGNK
jgi:hypothetical protein